MLVIGYGFVYKDLQEEVVFGFPSQRSWERLHTSATRFSVQGSVFVAVFARLSTGRSGKREEPTGYPDCSLGRLVVIELWHPTLVIEASHAPKTRVMEQLKEP